ncbi:MSHA biogenesis protein MshK [Vibrio artabrorum]|uniref:MSHA biogenesis protein MshK n=1 Tax=Vibrio artabrorum TaxID=446374 RepID=A0ABT8CF83_9VIBR|nr:MSHA biogenesis protein MshK [Vibrio artabrorum]MDN3700367.1 MSHA biogenesis protein MshK [Vibrio artabrorum]
MVRALLLSLLFSSSVAWAEQDPTAPLGWLNHEQKIASEKATPIRYRLPSLESIVCRGDIPCYAIMNGQVLGQGDTIKGYRVKDIAPEYVTLQRSSKQWKLEMFSLDVKNN